MRASRRSTQVSESEPSQKKEKENLNVNRKWGLYKGEEKSQSSAGESASASKGPTSQRRTTRARVAAEYENASTPPEQGIIRGHADNGVWSQAGQTPLSNITPLVAEPVVARQQLSATKARLSLSKEDGEDEDGGEDEENCDEEAWSPSGVHRALLAPCRAAASSARCPRPRQSLLTPPFMEPNEIAN